MSAEDAVFLIVVAGMSILMVGVFLLLRKGGDDE